MKGVKEARQEHKEVSFISVINALFGVILIIFFISTIVMRVYIPAAILLVSAVFIFFPQKILRFNKWLKLLITIVGLVIALMIVGFNLPSRNHVFANYNLNDEFLVSYNHVNISMIIYNSSKESKLIVDGKEKTTSGVFLVVRGSATNLGDTPSGFSFSSALLDSQNKSYSIFSFNIGEGAIQPGVKRDFINTFEIPTNSSGLKFVVGDETNILKAVSLGI